MIGKIKMPKGEAVLTDGGEWKCSDAEVSRYLNLYFDPRGMTGLGNVMPFGVHAVNQGALAVGGIAEVVVRVPPLPDGVES